MPLLNISVSLPRPDVRARAAELGAEPLRPVAYKSASEKREAAKCRTLTDQIRAAERRVGDAERTFARVRAAKVLLESNPEEDFAAKLRAVTAELEAAEKDRAAAVADLETIRAAGEAPPLWASAANAAHLAVDRPLDARERELWNELEAARRAVDVALGEVREAVANVVAQRLVVPLAELLALTAARDTFGAHKARILAEVRESLIGAPPAGCVPTDAQHRGWRAERPARA